jgi:hypothetical protein
MKDLGELFAWWLAGVIVAMMVALGLWVTAILLAYPVSVVVELYRGLL